jgi:hypothetical protein
VKPSISESVTWAFRGWDKVRTYQDSDLANGDRLVVKLELGFKAFEQNREDVDELGERLFTGTDSWKLVELVKKQRSRLGLRHYGRKRRLVKSR